MKGFLINFHNSLYLIDSKYYELLVRANTNGALTQVAINLLKLIMDEGDNVVYLTDEDTYQNVDDLLEAKNDELVKTMMPALKELEDKNIKANEIGKIKRAIRDSLGDMES